MTAPPGGKSVLCGLFQRAKLALWLFLIIVNDLAVTNLNLWKYVDDTTGSEITGKEAISQANMAVNEIYDWSINHKMQLNQEKCKEMQIGFSNNRNLEEIPCIIVSKGISSRVCKCVNLIGVHRIVLFTIRPDTGYAGY